MFIAEITTYACLIENKTIFEAVADINVSTNSSLDYISNIMKSDRILLEVAF